MGADKQETTKYWPNGLVKTAPMARGKKYQAVNLKRRNYHEREQELNW
jgi:hypothetical protein